MGEGWTACAALPLRRFLLNPRYKSKGHLTPAAVARSDPRLPGMGMVAGSILTSGRLHSKVEFGHEIISTAILSPSADSRRTVVCYWRKNMY